MNSKPEARIILQKLGLSKDEAAVYYLLLQSGDSTVGDISKSIDFSRAKIYGVLDNLLSRKAVKQVSKHPRIYSPINPRKLANSYLKEVKEASELAKTELSDLYSSKERDYLETITLRDMEIFRQVQEMCERSQHTIDIVAAILPSALPKSLCRALSDSSSRGVKIRLLFPKGDSPLDLSRLQGHFEVRQADVPTAGMVIMDGKELCMGGANTSEANLTMLGIWLKHAELSKQSSFIFEALFSLAEPYKN